MPLGVEITDAARLVLRDLLRADLALGGAYQRALTSAAAGGGDHTDAFLIAAIESARQATRAPAQRSQSGEVVEIVTVRRFRAAGREFEPEQRYRLTPSDFAEVEWRAALEPRSPLFRSSL